MSLFEIPLRNEQLPPREEDEEQEEGYGYAAALTILEAEGVDIDPELWAQAVDKAKQALRDCLEMGLNGIGE